MSLGLITFFVLFQFQLNQTRRKKRHNLAYHRIFHFWVTQRQTPTLISTRLFYQSWGSYFDLANNTESVMMFSAEHPLQSDCRPCLLVLFRWINLTAEWSGLLLPLFSIPIIFQSISHETEKKTDGENFFCFKMT